MATAVTNQQRVVVLKKTEEYDVLRIILEKATQCCVCEDKLTSGQQVVKLHSHDISLGEAYFCNKACFKSAERKARNRHRQSAKKAKKSTLFFIMEGLS